VTELARSQMSAAPPGTTTLEGEADRVWDTLRAAHEAMLLAGANGGLSHVKIASVQRTMGSLTAKFR
jgi:uncharacterized protein YqgV (UPF0045/DUF77 family)